MRSIARALLLAAALASSACVATPIQLPISPDMEGTSTRDSSPGGPPDSGVPQQQDAALDGSAAPTQDGASADGACLDGAPGDGAADTSAVDGRSGEAGSEDGLTADGNSVDQLADDAGADDLLPGED